MGDECAKVRSDIEEKTKKISDATESNPKFEYDGSTYKIPTKRGIFEITKEEADALFADFSRHGANLS